jgi:antitoxin (DNA-binding transcriptional repressor) of toxin-antitoxin stability system
MPASGILHLVLEENFRSTSQGEQNSRKELWLDLGNGNYRAVSREASGGSEIVVVRNGRTVAQLVPSDRRAFTQILPDDNAPQLNSVREQLLIHKQAAEQGGLTLLGEESASGRAALKVRPNGLPPTERVELWLDKDYGLLLREVISRRDGDAWEEVSNRGVSYPTIEVLTAGQAGEELFSTNVPPEYEQEITRLLTPVMAGTVRDLDLYWLGEQYGGMRAPYLIEQQVPGPRGAPVTLYSIAYTPAPSEPQSPPPDAAAMENQVTVINRLMSQEEITARERGERPPNSESVTVGGRRGIVINLQQDQQPSGGSQNAGQARPASSSAPNVVLDLTAGNTNIQILAKDRGRAVQAGEALVRLN